MTGPSRPAPALRNADNKGHGTKLHGSAMVARPVGERLRAEGAGHRKPRIDRLDGDGFSHACDVFAAMRVTGGGVGQEIPFVVGTPVEPQGLSIPADQATPGTDDPGLPVPHVTHGPFGFVVHDGRTCR